MATRYPESQYSLDQFFVYPTGQQHHQVHPRCHSRVSDGIKTNNVFSVALKIFPMGNESLFTSLNGQLIYNELQTPRINNSLSMQVGVQLD